jgi:hypothetical protein
MICPLVMRGINGGDIGVSRRWNPTMITSAFSNASAISEVALTIFPNLWTPRITFPGQYLAVGDHFNMAEGAIYRVTFFPMSARCAAMALPPFPHR